MKLADQERKALAIAIAPAIVALKLTETPKPRDGAAKKVSPDFAAAVWIKRYTEQIAKVLEGERDQGSDAARSSGFPS